MTVSFDTSFSEQPLIKKEAWRPNKLRCNRNSRSRNRAFVAHDWNTPKSNPNDHINKSDAKQV